MGAAGLFLVVITYNYLCGEFVKCIAYLSYVLMRAILLTVVVCLCVVIALNVKVL